MAWEENFGDRDGNNSIILEAVANEGLHIWHAYFGLQWTNNNLTVLNRSPFI
jgi:hypothetical protein